MRRLIIPLSALFLGLLCGCSCDNGGGNNGGPCPDGSDSCGQACSDVVNAPDAGPGFACGEACTTTTDCPSGYYCSDADVCSADCWTDGDEYCPGGTCDAEGRCDIPDPVDAGPDGSFCETQALMPQALIPDVMILADRSGSMQSSTPTGTRWSDAVSAVSDTALSYGDVMRLGFAAFPTYLDGQHPDDCQLDATADVPIALNNGSLISTTVMGIPDSVGGTPTTGAVLLARDELLSSSSPAGTPGYVILIADGQSNCGCAPNSGGATSCAAGTDSGCAITPRVVSGNPPGDWPDPPCTNLDCMDCGDGNQAHDGSSDLTTEAIDNLFINGIRTFVIGFHITGTTPGTPGGFMSDWGAAGFPGYDYGGGATYLSASTSQDLVDAISDIAAGVVPCDYELDEIPDDPSYVRVQLDGNDLYLNQDPGWTISGATVTLTGSACDTLQDGSPHDLVVQRECNQIIIP